LVSIRPPDPAVRVLLTEEQVREGVERMAAFVSGRYGKAPLTILGVMTGSVMLLADLIRLLEMPLRVGVVQASSYRGQTIRGELVVLSELLPDLAGRDVLLLDDIFDTGHTLLAIVEHLKRRGAASICTAVLLRKAERKEVAVDPDFAAFDIPNEFVVGYGLDFHDEYRNLPFIGVLEPADLERHSP
jgi:hypoxanthine phosphoribosyltransferase